MSSPDTILSDYTVSWDDIDNAYRHLDDPDVGVVLIEDPPETESIRLLLHELEEVATEDPSYGVVTVEGCGEDLHGKIRPNFRYLGSRGIEELPTPRIELNEDLKLKILFRLERSIFLRREVSRRFVEDSNLDLYDKLEPYVNPPNDIGISVRDHEYGVYAQSRIDCHNNGVEPQNFNAEPHGDDTLFTEHGGSTARGLRIIEPKSSKLIHFDVPDGYIMLSRGTDWQLGRTPEHTAFIHAADTIDSTKARARWVALWRVPYIRSHVSYHNPEHLARCTSAKNHKFKQLLNNDEG